MKQYSLTFLFSLLIICSLTACGSRTNQNTPNSANETHLQNPETIVPEVNTPTTDATLLTPEDAESIALNHAGLTNADVTKLYTEYKIDDGIPEYEIQFYQDRLEYDYTIHAETGDILSHDRDND